jgi:hypothetical protein
MKKLLLRALTLTALFVGRAVAFESFDDIEYWIGSGANQAALVLDWNGTTTTDNSLAWGFRWDGSAKGIDMLTAIVTDDPRLYLRMGPIGDVEFGYGVFGIGYDANNDGEFAAGYDTNNDQLLDEFVTFDPAGIAITEPSDGFTSLDPEDWYAEGWFISKFWNYGVATSSPFDGGTWMRSGSGITNRNLTNGSWHSLAYTPINTLNYAQNPIAAPVSGDADFDGDGDVDGRDFLAWQRGFGITNGALPEQGDANGDGAVNAADLEFWSDQYGDNSNMYAAMEQTQGMQPLGLVALSIPEPSTGLLIPFVVLLTCCTRFKRKLVS